MEKRRIILGNYDTAVDGLWTLTAWKLSDPAYDKNIIKIPGSSTIIDLSTALSDGEPTYGPRTLTATFEGSEGTRLDRKAIIDKMVNSLDGKRVDIILPDDADHYVIGRLSIKENYNDMAHASVSVEAVCEPWRYDLDETVVTLSGMNARVGQILSNNGRKSIVPAIEIVGAEMTLTFEGYTWALSPGTYVLPDIYLTPGDHELTYSGEGSTAYIRWRGAKL